MAASDRRTREVERAVVDATEAWLLRDRVGGAFSAVVVDAEDGRGTVVLDDLAVLDDDIVLLVAEVIGPEVELLVLVLIVEDDVGFAAHDD